MASGIRHLQSQYAAKSSQKLTAANLKRLAMSMDTPSLPSIPPKKRPKIAGPVQQALTSNTAALPMANIEKVLDYALKTIPETAKRISDAQRLAYYREVDDEGRQEALKQLVDWNENIAQAVIEQKKQLRQQAISFEYFSEEAADGFSRCTGLREDDVDDRAHAGVVARFYFHTIRR